MSYVEKFDSLSVKQDSGLGKDDVSIENPNNKPSKPTSVLQQIISSIKHWFGK